MFIINHKLSINIANNGKHAIILSWHLPCGKVHVLSIYFGARLRPQCRVHKACFHDVIWLSRMRKGNYKYLSHARPVSIVRLIVGEQILEPVYCCHCLLMFGKLGPDIYVFLLIAYSFFSGFQYWISIHLLIRGNGISIWKKAQEMLLSDVWEPNPN
jgi:hypothetical protein